VAPETTLQPEVDVPVGHEFTPDFEYHWYVGVLLGNALKVIGDGSIFIHDVMLPPFKVP
jgi:hypothetical protein